MKVHERRRLDAAGWQTLVLDVYTEDLEAAAKRVMADCPDPLARPLLVETQTGWRVLETGSGWGALSAALAQRGRHVTLLDWSPEIVARGKDLLWACQLEGQGVCANLLHPLPFADGSFDCVWSSGVLEHFDEAEQLGIIRESARVARRTVIAQVPNAWSMAYRVGKWHMERRGTWSFGYERPARSLGQLFERAGLGQVRETTVHAERSAWFFDGLPGGERLRRLWIRLCRAWPEAMEGPARQGYMLVTVGNVT